MTVINKKQIIEQILRSKQKKLRNGLTVSIDIIISTKGNLPDLIKVIITEIE